MNKKRMDKKGALELSINFIVMLVLCIIVLGLGIAFAKQFFEQAHGISKELDKQTIQQLENLMAAGKQVAVPFSTKTASSGETVVYGLGIMNNVAGSSNDFTIDVTFKNAYDKNENEITGSNADQWIVQDTRTVQVKINEKARFSIVISVPKRTAPGTYIFDVSVMHDSKAYGDSPVYKIYVNVA